MSYAYRPRILWMQGTEVRHATHSELFVLEEIAGFGEGLADAVAENGAVTFETRRGDWHTIPARLITDVHYQRVEVDSAHQPETIPTRTPGATLNREAPCLTHISGACNGTTRDCLHSATKSVTRHPYGTCEIPHTTADDEDACENQRLEMAAQEARHPGLGRILNALVTQLPPDDPEKCAETLAAMDAAGPLNGARDCPSFPEPCTCKRPNVTKDYGPGETDGA